MADAVVAPFAVVLALVLRMVPYSTVLVGSIALLFWVVLAVADEPLMKLIADGCGGGGTSGGHVGTLAK